MPNKIATIRAALLNYEQGGVYGICFNMDEPLELNSTEFDTPFILNIPGGETHNVYIKGLELRNDDAFPVMHEMFKVQHDGSGTVVLDSFDLKDVKNGLLLEGSGKTEVRSSTIAGDASKSGVCVEIKSNGAVVRGGEISSCAEGVVIEADDVLIGAANHEHFDADRNSIHDNVIGLHVVSGAHNKFGYNLIYDNKPSLVPEGTAEDAILVEFEANEDLIPLEVVYYEYEGENYAINCQRDESGVVVSRSMRFEAPQTGGSVSLYQVFINNQPIKYLTTCTLDDAGDCSLDDLPPDVVTQFTDTECGIEEFLINAIYTGTSSTELMSKAALFDGWVAFVSSPYDIPTTSGLAGDDGASSMPEEDDDGGGSSMGGDGVGTEGGSGVIEAAGGVAGGCGGGASLAGDSFRTAALLMDLWWNLLLVGVILGLRKAYARVHRDHRR
jgi:hypothetical protein